MGTVATATKIAGVSCLGPECYFATYTLALDTTTAGGLQTVDFTADFVTIDFIHIGGNDTAADNNYAYRFIHPGVDVAISSSNVTLEVRDEALAVENATTMTDVGALQVLVFGKKA